MKKIVSKKAAKAVARKQTEVVPLPEGALPMTSTQREGYTMLLERLKGFIASALQELGGTGPYSFDNNNLVFVPAGPKGNLDGTKTPPLTPTTTPTEGTDPQ